MMTFYPFQPITVNDKTIHWQIISGTVMDVQKYSKTHVKQSGSGESISVRSWNEIIIELFIEQDNGSESYLILKKQDTSEVQHLEGMAEIRVRVGQRVSGVTGSTSNDRTSDCLIFVNHDDRQWYWVVAPALFIKSVGITIVPLWLHALILLVLSSIGFILVSSANFIVFGIGILWVMILVLILTFAIYIYHGRREWKRIRSQIAAMARQLI